MPPGAVLTDRRKTQLAVASLLVLVVLAGIGQLLDYRRDLARCVLESGAPACWALGRRDSRPCGESARCRQRYHLLRGLRPGGRCEAIAWNGWRGLCEAVKGGTLERCPGPHTAKGAACRAAVSRDPRRCESLPADRDRRCSAWYQLLLAVRAGNAQRCAGLKAGTPLFRQCHALLGGGEEVCLDDEEVRGRCRAEMPFFRIREIRP